MSGKSVPEEFNDFLRKKLGTKDWVVAQRLTDRLKGKGYILAVTQRKFRELSKEYEQKTGSKAF
jgi:hypothetical protein